MAFLHFNFTHIFFEANESLKYGARLQAALLKADIFTHCGTLSLRMKSLYLAVERCVCVCIGLLCIYVCMCEEKKIIWYTGLYISELLCVCVACFFQHGILSGRTSRKSDVFQEHR